MVVLFGIEGFFFFVGKNGFGVFWGRLGWLFLLVGLVIF